MRAPLFVSLVLSLFATQSSAETYVVQQVAQSFQPRDITINVGDTVRWTWAVLPHTVTEGTDGTADGDEAFSGHLDGQHTVYEMTFDQAFLDAWPRVGNVYDYFCVPHFVSGMVGSVTVSDGPGVIFCACDGEGSFPACGNFGHWGEGCRNSSGGDSQLLSHGSASVSADDLAFEATALLPGQPALLFVGTAQVNAGDGLAFGDGLRCAGGAVVRLGISVPDGGGVALWAPGLAPAGGWSAGDTRYFQAWYRDPVGGPCGTGFNLTNGLGVDFTN